MDIRRNLLRGFSDLLRQRRQLRRLARSPRLVLDYARFKAATRRRDWAGLQTLLRPLATAATKAQDYRLMRELGAAALRLDEPQLAIELIAAGRRGLGVGIPTDWRGEDISDATLIIRLVEGRERKPATGMSLVGHIAAAASRAKRTILVVEPRTAPLYRRSLPGILVCGDDEKAPQSKTGRVVTATLSNLQSVFGYDHATIARLRRPLVADANETAELRERYRAGRSLSLVGISWHAPQSEKDSPPLEPWLRLVKALPVQFVSVQRGADAKEVSALSGGVPGKIIVDPTVDQMSNIDRFASQVAALDLVITLSNTGAHVAGALGRPMILVRDDLFRLAWPYLSRRVPWYPDAVVIGRDGRSWDAVFDEIAIDSKGMLDLKS